MTLFSKHFFTFTHDHHDYNHLIFQIMTFCKKKRAFSSRSSSSPASLPSSSSCAASFAAAETARANTRSVCQAKTKEKDKDKKTKVKFFMCHIICSSRNYQVNIYAKTKKKTKTKAKQILVELYSLSMSVQQYSFQHSWRCMFELQRQTCTKVANLYNNLNGSTYGNKGILGNMMHRAEHHKTSLPD